MNNKQLERRIFEEIKKDRNYLPFSDAENPESEAYRSHVRDMRRPNKTANEMELLKAEFAVCIIKYRQVLEERLRSDEKMISTSLFLDLPSDPQILLQIHSHCRAKLVNEARGQMIIETQIENPEHWSGFMPLQAEVDRSLLIQSPHRTYR